MDGIKVIDGGVTAPKGFSANGAVCGIKKSGKDMAMIYSTAPCEVAGTFTTNLVKAAPVKWDREIVDSGKKVHAVVVNSGVANACTGAEGLEYCRRTAAKCADAFALDSEQQVLVASTGVIGKQIPIDKIEAGIGILKEGLAGTREAAVLAAEAIMTTDTRKKEAAVSLTLSGKMVTVAGMCKGSGMIHPNMCTMLSFITTDAAISKKLLQKALSASVKESYNMVSVDGDTSTNDTCLVLANGEAGNVPVTEEGPDYLAFAEALHQVNTSLAKQMAADGEGATAMFEVKMTGCSTKEQAVTLAKSVVSSSLTKAAIYGHDANWGRILCAMGYSGAIFDPEKVDLYFSSEAGTIKIIENGVATDYSEEEATKILSESAVTATADLKMGTEEATAWGCDLTHEYVSINADYRS